MDEETERKLALQTIELQIQKCLDNIRTIKEEREMLEMMIKMRSIKAKASEDDTDHRVESRQGSSGSLRLTGPLLSDSGKVQSINLNKYRESEKA